MSAQLANRYTGSFQPLGTLPPPASLVSVPNLPVYSFPLLSRPSVLALTTIPSLSPGQNVPGTTVPALNWRNTPSSQAGIILSPAADPIPQHIVQQIQSGQFVEMRQYCTPQSTVVTTGHSALPQAIAIRSRTRLREVPSLVSWLYCFNAVIAVRTSDPLTRNMLTYSRLLITNLSYMAVQAG